jgi:protein ImuA
MSTSSPLHRRQKVAQLQEELRRWEDAKRPAGAARTSTGCAPLDRLFPEGGVGRGTLVEWLAEGEGSGAMWLALVAAREACRGQGPLVVVDSEGTFYPPAAARAGIDLGRLIVVRAAQARDESWALDQSLRSGGVGAVLCMTDRLAQRAARRLQLAAESSGGVGLLVRPAAVRSQPCWSEVRLLVGSCVGTGKGGGRRLSIELLKTRGTVASELAEKRRLELEVDDETGVVRAVARLAPAAARRRSSGA